MICEKLLIMSWNFIYEIHRAYLMLRNWRTLHNYDSSFARFGWQMFQTLKPHPRPLSYQERGGRGAGEPACAPPLFARGGRGVSSESLA